MPSELYPDFKQNSPASSRISVACVAATDASDSPAGRSTGKSAAGRKLADGAGQVGAAVLCEAAGGGPSAVMGTAPEAADVFSVARVASPSRGALRVAVAPETPAWVRLNALLGKNANSSSSLEEEEAREGEKHPRKQAGQSTSFHRTKTQSKEQEEEAKNRKTIERFAMQGAARALLPGERVANCLRAAAWNADGIDCYHVPEVKGARLGGLQTCGSVWGCPVCAAKITERRRVELRRAVDAWRAGGGVVVMLTYTLPHLVGDNLGGLVNALMLARSRMMSGQRYSDKKRACGLMGSVRSLEVTHGLNGWHPHIHELAFFGAGADVTGFCEWLEGRWSRSVLAVGAGQVNEHGFDWSEAGDEIENYIAKWGHEPTAPVWDCAAEVTKQPAKLGKSKGRSPMQLLADFTATGDMEAGDLFRVYALEMKGRRQLEWSRWDTGERTAKDRAKTISFLTHVLPEVEEVSDLTLAECSENRGVLMARLSLAQWRLILADDVRAGLLNVLRTGDVNALAVFLAPYAEPDKSGRVVVSHSVRLVDWNADERDKLPVLGYDQRRPWDALQASLGSAACAVGLGERLYGMHLAGEEVRWFADLAAEKEQRRNAVRSLLEDASGAGASSSSAPAPVSLFDGVETPAGQPSAGGGVVPFFQREASGKKDHDDAGRG